MTLSTPSSGHAPGLPADGGLSDGGPRNLAGLDTIEGRISAWCAWFGLEEPKLKRNCMRQVLLNDDLVTWLYVSGSSFDCIVLGNVRGMAVAYRKSEQSLRRLGEALKRFDDTEKRLLLDAIKTSQEGGVLMEEALSGWTKAVEDYRAQKQSSVSGRGK